MICSFIGPHHTRDTRNIFGKNTVQGIKNKSTILLNCSFRHKELGLQTKIKQYFIMGNDLFS